MADEPAVCARAKRKQAADAFVADAADAKRVVDSLVEVVEAQTRLKRAVFRCHDESLSNLNYAKNHYSGDDTIVTDAMETFRDECFEAMVKDASAAQIRFANLLGRASKLLPASDEDAEDESESDDDDDDK